MTVKLSRLLLDWLFMNILEFTRVVAVAFTKSPLDAFVIKGYVKLPIAYGLVSDTELPLICPDGLLGLVP